MRISITNEYGLTTYVDSIAPASNSNVSNVSNDDASSFSNVLATEEAALNNANNVTHPAGTVTYADLFNEAATTYGVDVNLLTAIAKQESNFKADAVSSAGAIGIMQLMPATAESLGVSNPYDARENIMGGAKYIRQMLDRYDGDVTLALAAYNAGSGNVAKYGGVPPFTETQNYVAKVTANYENKVEVPDIVYSSPAGSSSSAGAENAGVENVANENNNSNSTNSVQSATSGNAASAINNASTGNNDANSAYIRMLYETQGLINQLITESNNSQN
ncbi:MAG: lytic transglycosylase domain-containing protein [Lachnospiraceae bacterium]|nr:lytic transglycosylase domain-containing protein [Lachnospiraceae bacterium]